MGLDVHPLKRLILEGEHSQQDFKQTITSSQKIAKTIAAFSNTRGGRILIGVKDNGRVSGVDVEQDLHMIDLACSMYCRPEIKYTYNIHSYQGLHVAQVNIPESRQKPHSARGEDNRWWVYIRVDDKCMLASKVVVDVLRNESEEKELVIQYTSKENSLLEYLSRHERITLKEYCKMLNISRRRAMRILVNLIRAGVIRVHTTEKTEFYTLS